MSELEAGTSLSQGDRCPGHGRWVLFMGGPGVRAQDVLERLSSFFGNRVYFLGYRSIR